MYTTLTEAFWYVADWLRKHPQQRKGVAIISGIALVLAGVAFAFGVLDLFAFFPKELFNNVAATLALIGGIGLLESIAAYLPPESIPPFLYRQEMREIREEREEIKGRSAQKQKTDLFDTVQLSLNEIREYCVLNKKQAWSSFGFGVFAILLGLATLVYGVGKFYEGASPNVTMASLVSVSGILIQFLGGTCLYLYRTTLKQGNFYFAHLVQMQDMMLAIKLCGETADETKRSALQEKIIDSLLMRTASIPSLPSNVESASRAQRIK